MFEKCSRPNARPYSPRSYRKMRSAGCSTKKNEPFPATRSAGKSIGPIFYTQPRLEVADEKKRTAKHQRYYGAIWPSCRSPRERELGAHEPSPGATSTTHRHLRHLNGARSPRMRPKSYFLCAPAQVIGWVGRSPARVRASSSANDHRDGRNAATSEFHCAQPRRVTKMVLDAPECAQRRPFDSHLPR